MTILFLFGMMMVGILLGGVGVVAGFAALGVWWFSARENRWERAARVLILPFVAVFSFGGILLGVHYIGTWVRGVDMGMTDFNYVPLGGGYQLSFIDGLENGWVAVEGDGAEFTGVQKLAQRDQELFMVGVEGSEKAEGKTRDWYGKLNLGEKRAIAFRDEAEFSRGLGDLNLDKASDFYVRRYREVMFGWDVAGGVVGAVVMVVACWVVWRLIGVCFVMIRALQGNREDRAKDGASAWLR